jgi:hypothetical protein
MLHFSHPSHARWQSASGMKQTRSQCHSLEPSCSQQSAVSSFPLIVSSAQFPSHSQQCPVSLSVTSVQFPSHSQQCPVSFSQSAVSLSQSSAPSIPLAVISVQCPSRSQQYPVSLSQSAVSSVPLAVSSAQCPSDCCVANTRARDCRSFCSNLF